MVNSARPPTRSGPEATSPASAPPLTRAAIVAAVSRTVLADDAGGGRSVHLRGAGIAVHAPEGIEASALARHAIRAAGRIMSMIQE